MPRIIIAGHGQGVGKYLPDRIIDNTEMVSINAQHGLTTTNSGKPLTAEGIGDLLKIDTRRWARSDQNTSDMALFAAQMALDRRGIGWKDLNMIVVGSSSPESFFPSTACSTLFKSGKPRIEAFDLLAACTSAVYAIAQVDARLMREEDYKFGMVIGAEMLATRMNDYSDINSNLWTDAGGALLLEKVDDKTDSGIICSILGSDPSMEPATRSIGKGTRTEDLGAKPKIFMVGRDVQKFIRRIIPELIPATIAKANRILVKEGKDQITLDDIALFAMHQPNGRSLEITATEMGISLEKVPVTVNKYANSSSAAVLITLCEAIEEGKVKKGDLIIIISFGGGITWASVLLRL